MKRLFENILIIALISIMIYVSIGLVISNQKNKQHIAEILKLQAQQEYRNNLNNVEHNSWQIEYFFNKKENINHCVLEKDDKSTILFSDLIKNESKMLCFFVHENSCPACMEIEFNRIKNISDSLKMPIIIICMSKSWRFIKLLQQNYNMKNEFYRLEINHESLNEELLFLPFYFLTDKNCINFLFVPLKEQIGRTIKYFEFLKSITNS